jgi:CLIP-associating protein 1/2
VITVLVIAESADNCIKTVMKYDFLFSVILYRCNFVFSPLSSIFQMLRNCKVARVLPRIADCAKNDRSAILRARYELSNFGG